MTQDSDLHDITPSPIDWKVVEQENEPAPLPDWTASPGPGQPTCYGSYDAFTREAYATGV